MRGRSSVGEAQHDMVVHLQPAPAGASQEGFTGKLDHLTLSAPARG